MAEDTRDRLCAAPAVPIGLEARGRMRERAAVLAENARLARAEAGLYDRNHFEIFNPWEQARLRRDLARYAWCHRVLDVGSGTGNVVTKVAAPQRIALDLSTYMLRWARAKDPRVALVIGLAESLPFQDATFDLVVAYSTLHHLSDWSPLAEMARVARPGGVVLLDHEEAFQEPGWRAAAYRVLRGGWVHSRTRGTGAALPPGSSSPTVVCRGPTPKGWDRSTSCSPMAGIRIPCGSSGSSRGSG